MVRANSDLLADANVRELANIYFAFRMYYLNAESEIAQKYIRKLASESWNQLDMVNPWLVSKAAYEKAMAEGLPDPRTVHWTDRKKLNGSESWRAFCWEHAYTRKDFVCELFAEGEKGIDDIIDLIKRSQIVWILRSEDEKLNSLDYKSKRPNGWRAAYAEAGIEICIDENTFLG